MQLDVESLRAFITVLNLGGMTAAADELGISQSAVSWKIKRLEERVGRDLLMRDGRRLSPSRDGRELLDYAQTIVATHDAAVTRLSATGLEGTVKLGSTEEASALCTGAVCGRFSRIHPNVDLDFHVDRSSRLASMIAANQLDVAVLQLRTHDVRARDTVLWHDTLMWVSSPDWTYDEGTVPLITFGEDGFYRPIAEAALRDADIPHRVAFSGPSTASVLSAVSAGTGVALLSSRSVAGDVIQWPRGNTVEHGQPVVNVARAARGAASEVAAELLADIRAELGEVPAEAA
ncbi:MAG: LysR family transcriptional regulator [Acidimicrobiales bacterium]|nr:LysR family transcriptional regulator [Acidimicrobiales bacterium]MDG1876983.1 LysR family transcriptional regulator [Acidimicrobiales bacterium]